MGELFSEALTSVRPSTCATDLGTVSSWRTAGKYHPNHELVTQAAYFTGEGFKIIDGEVLSTNPITWASGAGSAASDPAQYKGAFWPLPSNMDPRSSECGTIPSGMSLRFGHTVAGSRDILGAHVRELVPVDCGTVVAQVDDHGFVRVPHFKKGSLFSLAERDWLLYHDVDCALFHNNLQENIALRVEAWCPSSRLLGRVERVPQCKNQHGKKQRRCRPSSSKSGN